MMNILVVDDSAVMRKMITRQLVKLGFSEGAITEASDGAEAIEMCRKSQFQLILMDWNMPNMLGIDALKAIREMGMQTPVIMVTSESERQNIILAVQAGATNYIVKPFTEDVFRTKVGQTVSLPDAGEAAGSAPESAGSSKAAEGKIKVDFASGRIELD